MSLNPIGSSITITDGVSATATLIVEAITYQTVFEPFDRVEYDNQRLAGVPTACGEKRLLGANLAGKPYQIVYGCSDQQAVPLIPNSEAIFDQVKKKFKIKRYTITGAFCESQEVNDLYDIASDHQNLLAQFQGYQARSTGDISYTDLYALRSLTFSYLTATGITMSGTALDATETNMLITNMSAEIVLSIPTATPGVNEFYKTFNITIENRVIEALRI